MSNSLWSRPKELALIRKLRIYIISDKEDNLLRYTQTFENFFLEISVPFDLHPGISGIFGWMVRVSEIQQFPDRIFLNLSGEISLPFVPFWKISEFLVEWKTSIAFSRFWDYV